MGAAAEKTLLAGKHAYRAHLNDELILVNGGNQLTAARKLFRSRKLPREWMLEFVENDQVLDWWIFDELAEVLTPRARVL